MDERELMEIKWYDYRTLAPDVATLVFMNEWAKALCEYNEHLGKSRHFCFLKSFERFDLDYLKNKQRFGYFTKLRQWADKHRMRYDLYWSWAFDTHEKLGYGKTFESIFLGKKIKEGVLASQRSFERDIQTYASDDIFKAENYEGLEIQNDYYWHLIDQTKKRHPKNQWAGKIKMMVENDRMAKAFLSKFGSVTT